MGIVGGHRSARLRRARAAHHAVGPHGAEDGALAPGVAALPARVALAASDRACRPGRDGNRAGGGAGASAVALLTRLGAPRWNDRLDSESVRVRHLLAAVGGAQLRDDDL